jgi:hypothetical protein
VGLASDAFSRAENMRAWEFDRQEKLVWSLDFNVNPMCSVLVQRAGESVYVLDGLVLENANTPMACEVFLEKASKLAGGRTLWWMCMVMRAGLSGERSGRTWGLIREFFGTVVATENDGAGGDAEPEACGPGERDEQPLVQRKRQQRSSVDAKCKELIRDSSKCDDRWTGPDRRRPS